MEWQFSSVAIRVGTKIKDESENPEIIPKSLMQGLEFRTLNTLCLDSAYEREYRRASHQGAR